MFDGIRNRVAGWIAPKAPPLAPPPPPPEPPPLAQVLDDAFVEEEAGYRELARESESFAFRDKYMTVADAIEKMRARVAAIVAEE